MKVAVVTGTRAEYGIFRPVLRAISAERRLELQLVVTGMHLLEKFGNTVDEIERDGWGIVERVGMYMEGGSPGGALGIGVVGMDAAFARLEPDVVMLLGDRLEILAAAAAAMTRGIPIAHLHGGETAPGQFDEQIRHAVTKMAKMHFAATELAGKRIMQMGEDPRSVHVVGAPAIDEARRFMEEREKWAKKMEGRVGEGGRRAVRAGGAGGLGSEGLWPMVVLHPSSSDAGAEYRRAKLIVRSVRKVFGGIVPRVIGPNNDPGHEGILKAYEELAGEIELEMSVRQEAFWEMMAAGRVLVGNSSAGIIEAATLGCAVVNVGDRQKGRERSGNVIESDFKAGELEGALGRVLSDYVKNGAYWRRVELRKNVYGDGGAAERIVGVLKAVKKGELAGAKRFYDLWNP